MSERQERLQNRLQPEIREFRDGCRTLQLATVDGEGNPNASYAPFVLQEDGYYVLISEIARHARNLQQVPKVSLMLIEDETGARELFARKRLTFDAVAEVVARDDVRWKNAIAALEGRFGDIVKGLSNLKDFVLFRLKPEQGLFVKGFGQAFRVSGDELVDFVHLVEGHRPIDNKRIDNGAELTSETDAPV
ncbi:heme utilization protein HutZ [Aeromonas sanarellii]